MAARTFRLPSLWTEVIIADQLASKGIEYDYERPTTIDGTTKYPDFSVDDMKSGSTYYWEHCGILPSPKLPTPVGREVRMVPRTRDLAAGEWRRQKRER